MKPERADVAWTALLTLVFEGITCLFGLALLFSDLVHHFVVMMLVIGDHEFDLFYPVQ